MTSITDIANRALSSIGTRSQITSLTENSNEAKQCNILIEPLRNELLRMAPWNCAFNYNSLALVCATPGTPENPTQGSTTWAKGIPPPGWAYEYMYPDDCARACWIVPQFSTGFAGGVPITTAFTGAAPLYWNGPPVKYKVAIDQIDLSTGLPAVGGVDQRVILTNQAQAILAYVKKVTDPNVWDDGFQSAMVAGLAGRLVWALTGKASQANLKIQEANNAIQIARAGDGNEGLTINDVTPDWIRARGIVYDDPNGWSPTMFDWGAMLGTY